MKLPVIQLVKFVTKQLYMLTATSTYINFKLLPPHQSGKKENLPERDSNYSIHPPIRFAGSCVRTVVEKNKLSGRRELARDGIMEQHPRIARGTTRPLW